MSSVRPPRATNTRLGSFTQISSISGSSRYCCKGPNPAIESVTSRTAASASSRGGSDATSVRRS